MIRNYFIVQKTSFFLLFFFLQKAVKMLIDNIDKVPVSLVMMLYDVLLSFTQFVQPSNY